MELRIRFDMDNAAFDGHPEAEAARCLRHVADVMERGADDSGAIFDANGNRIGAWEVV